MSDHLDVRCSQILLYAIPLQCRLAAILSSHVVGTTYEVLAGVKCEEHKIRLKFYGYACVHDFSTLTEMKVIFWRLRSVVDGHTVFHRFLFFWKYYIYWSSPKNWDNHFLHRGLDFRQDYRKVGVIQSYVDCPVMTLTATVTQEMKKDLEHVLGMNYAATFSYLPNR